MKKEAFLNLQLAKVILLLSLLIGCSLSGVAQTSQQEEIWIKLLESKQYNALRNEVNSLWGKKRTTDRLKHRAQLYLYLTDLIERGKITDYKECKEHWDRAYSPNEEVYAPIVALFKGLWISNKLHKNTDELLSDRQTLKDLCYMIELTNTYARQEKYSKFGLYAEAIEANSASYRLAVNQTLPDTLKAIEHLTKVYEYATYEQYNNWQKAASKILCPFISKSSSYPADIREREKSICLLQFDTDPTKILNPFPVADFFAKIHSLSFPKESPTFEVLKLVVLQLKTNQHTIQYADLLYAYMAHLTPPKEVTLRRLYHSSMMQIAHYAFTANCARAALMITEKILDDLGEDRLTPDHVHYNLYLIRARSFLSNDQGEEAIESILKAINIAARIEGTNSILVERAYSELIDVCNSLRIYKEALPFYDEMMKIRKQVMSQQFSILTEDDRNRFWYGRAYDYAFLYKMLRNDSIVPRKEVATRLADASIFSKQLLLSSSDYIGQTIRQSKDPKIIAANNRLQELRAVYNDLLYDNSSSTHSEKNKELMKQLQSCEQELLRLVAPSLDFKEVWNRDWKDIQQKLSPNEAYVDYILISVRKNVNYLIAIMIRSNWAAPKIIQANPEVFIMQDEEKIKQADQNTFKSLSQIYFTNIEKQLKPNDRVYLSPGGLIHVLPFEVFPSNVDNRPLYERYDLRRVSTFEDIERAKHPLKIKNVLLIGGLNYQVDDTLRIKSMVKYGASKQFSYLRSSVEEINYIASKAAAKKIAAVKLVNLDAFESRIKSFEFAPNTVLHFATHALSNASVRKKYDPKSYRIDYIKVGGLALSFADEAFIDCKDDNWLGNGFLSSAEIELLNLRNVELVVLSACNTTDGMVNWEGVWGLHRAFKKAGAKSLLVTLWDVNDQLTARFMKIFYDNLFESNNRHQAFRKAQNTVKIEFPNDPSWAAFVMLD